MFEKIIEVSKQTNFTSNNNFFCERLKQIVEKFNEDQENE
ncbi:Cps1G [Streptococcus suis ST1]|uniref:Putative glycosyltransferase n=1 Tax=Streptococcus suis TaxID=1307 RepID=M1VD60_STRSU|nr:Cps1G [Streptococcus suis ST1]BAM94505.1 putative glycosyltransferase [Streptococcus suis]